MWSCHTFASSLTETFFLFTYYFQSLTFCLFLYWFSSSLSINLMLAFNLYALDVPSFSYSNYSKRLIKYQMSLKSYGNFSTLVTYVILSADDPTQHSLLCPGELLNKTWLLFEHWPIYTRESTSSCHILG